MSATEATQAHAPGERWTTYMRVRDLVPAPRNPNRHLSDDIAASVDRHGSVEPMVLDERTGRLVAGHGRRDDLLRREAAGEAPPEGILLDDDGAYLALVLRGWSSASDAEAEAYLVASNLRPDWDPGGLAELLADLASAPNGLAGTGYTDTSLAELLEGLGGGSSGTEGDEPEPTVIVPKLADRFLVPPFSILDARQGWWKNRKRQWLALGIRSELGRDEQLLSTGTPRQGYGSGYDTTKGENAWGGSGTSIFDPVICELVYRWFLPEGGSVLDPFAGGSVRGVVAAKLGHSYTGIDLRAEQVEANYANATEVLGTEPEEAPTWAEGYHVPALTRVAKLFNAYDAGLVLGAFVGMNEAAVAQRAKAGRLHTWGPSRTPTVAVIGGVRTSKASIADHVGPLGATEPGALIISRVACAPGKLDELLGCLDELRAGHTGEVVAELWQEHPHTPAIVEHLGLQRIGTKVRASSELVGIYTTNPAGYTQRTKVDDLGLCPLDVKVPAKALAALVARLPELDATWADHYSSYNEGSTWKALALRAYGGRTEFIEKPAEMSKAWKAANPEALDWGIEDTPLRAELPEAEALLALIPGTHHRVRLMRLDGTGTLGRHADITDREAGTEPGALMRIHLPLVTSPEVLFTSWLPDGSQLVANMPKGAAWYLDTRKPHTASNGGTTERVHLVVDTEATPELLAMLGTAPEATPLPEPDPVPEWTATIPRWQLPFAAEVAAGAVTWLVGDAANATEVVASGTRFDLVFTCPPYADLEVYSDNPADLSTMDWAGFRAAYRQALAHAVQLLDEDRFLAIVVGEVRDAHGNYLGFVPETVAAAEAAGAHFYGEAIIASPIGSLPIRAGRHFAISRKLGKAHQNLLLFVKGDGRRAAEACGEVNVEDALTQVASQIEEPEEP